MGVQIKKRVINIPYYLFFVIAFIEGGAVMVIELLGAKMITPYYGNSLYVWTSVLGVTLLGLASGYFTGGWISQKFRYLNLLFVILSAGAFFIALMPVLSVPVMLRMDSFGIRTGALISCLIFLFPPLLCMGMVSPVIIQLVTHELSSAGSRTGMIYAISTSGGILCTFLFGFFIVPVWGITMPLLYSALFFSLIPAVYSVKSKKYLFLLPLLLVMIPVIRNKKTLPENIPIHLNYQSEGMLGQILVLEHTELKERRLYLNGIPQTYVKTDYRWFSMWPYIHRISTLASIKPAGAQALVLGFGGGSIAAEMVQLGFETDAVDIDIRLKQVAKNFFYYDESRCQLIIDDVRHYIKTTPKKYDVVIFDLLTGEVQPSHAFTKEGFIELKQILNPDAMVIINFQGYVQGEFSLGGRSIYRTIEETGYYVKNWHWKRAEDENLDVLFVATLRPLDILSESFERQNQCCRYFQFDLRNDLISSGLINTQGTFLLTDDKPILEYLNILTIEKWRKGDLLSSIRRNIELGIPLFK